MDCSDTSVNLQTVKPEDLHFVWQTIKPGIEKAAHFAQGAWIPEDAYSSIQHGQASLFLWSVDKRYAGSIIVMTRAGFEGKTLHIFSLYVEPEYGEHIDANMDQIDELARNHGCRKITFQSPRRGWDKRAERLGFEPVTTTYEKEV